MGNEQIPARWRKRVLAVAVVSSLTLPAACGGGDGGGGGGGPTGPSGGGPGPSGATITIGATGTISPSAVTITVGQSVTFVNNDSRPHNMASDPHPTHTNCPPLNSVGLLAQGQTKVSNAFTAPATCGFHDHDRPDENGLKGTVTIR